MSVDGGLWETLKGQAGEMYFDRGLKKAIKVNKPSAAKPEGMSKSATGDLLRRIVDGGEYVGDVLDAVGEIANVWNMPERKKNPLGYLSAATKTLSSVSKFALRIMGEGNQGNAITRQLGKKSFELMRADLPHLEAGLVQLVFKDLPYKTEPLSLGSDEFNILTFDLGGERSVVLVCYQPTASPGEINQRSMFYKTPWYYNDGSDGCADWYENWIRERVWATHGGRGLEISVKYCQQTEEYYAHFAALGSFKEDLPVFGMAKGIAERTEKFRKAGLSRKIMLYGAPGTGKTTLARRIGDLMGGKTLVVGPYIADSDDTYNVMRATQDWIEFLKPSVIIFDDFDRVSHSDRFLGFVDSMKSEENPVVLFMTVNSLSRKFIDPAMLRPGRTDEIHYVASPDENGLRLITDFFCEQYGVDRLTDEDIKSILTNVPNASPADLRGVVELVKALGKDMALDELGRIANQRDLYCKNRDREEDEINAAVSMVRRYDSTL